MTKPVEAALIGAGARGTFVYGSYALKKPFFTTLKELLESAPERSIREMRTAGRI